MALENKMKARAGLSGPDCRPGAAEKPRLPENNGREAVSSIPAAQAYLLAFKAGGAANVTGSAGIFVCLETGKSRGDAKLSANSHRQARNCLGAYRASMAAPPAKSKGRLWMRKIQKIRH
jgi:hypothetical protein